MSRTTITCVALTGVLLLAGCNHKIQNPMANIDSKQPDKVLFDRAMDSMKHARFEEARTLLENLINTYPESEYIARAKLAVGDSWYTEGGTAAWKQAEVEYKDFQTFFPNMPEAAEAQLRIATMHYREMEKPDRDFVEASRAADEYKALIQQYPDSPLVPEAKQRLREVQEDLAERQYRIAHFYYLRENLAAAQARLQSLVDSYPLYSGVDEALFELGGLYEREALAVRRQHALNGAVKEKMGAQFEQHAIDAYSRIITRYPVMRRANDARARLRALNAPIPTPTAEAIAANRMEEQSRGSITMSQSIIGDFKKHPNLARSSKTGEPNLNQEEVTSAADVVKELNAQMIGAAAPTKLGIEAVGSGSGKPGGTSLATPAGAGTPAGKTSGTPSANPGASGTPSGTPVAANSPQTGPRSGGSTVADGAPPSPALPQVNEVQKSAADAQDGTQSTDNATSSGNSKKDSSSKKKGKKRHKLLPF